MIEMVTPQWFEHPKFGRMRAMFKDGQVLFCGVDVAACLGYAHWGMAVERHCEDAKMYSVAPSEMILSFISYGDVCNLVEISNLGYEKNDFIDWIYDEIIPALNETKPDNVRIDFKNGSYIETLPTQEEVPMNQSTGGNEMTGLQVFKNEQFGQVRTIEEEGKVLFCASDVAKALGYTNPPKATSDHCRCITKRYIPHPQSPDKTLEVTFIPEPDLYRLITHSKLPAAEQFERWVFEEVLPTIRKHGAYMTPETIDKMIADPQFGIRLLTELQTEQEQHKITKEEKRRLEAQIEADKPLVETMKRITASDDLINLETYAKMLNDKHGFTGGRNTLIRIMRELGILFKNPGSTSPTQYYIDNGCMKKKMKTAAWGLPPISVAFVTGKGVKVLTPRILDYCNK